MMCISNNPPNTNWDQLIPLLDKILRRHFCNVLNFDFFQQNILSNFQSHKSVEMLSNLKREMLHLATLIESSLAF